MKSFSSLVALCLFAGTAWSSSFEISDPAKQFFQEQEAETTEAPEADPGPSRPLRCTVDLETGACQCENKNDDSRADVGPAECAELVRAALKAREAW